MSNRFVQELFLLAGTLALAALFLPASVWVGFAPVDSADPFSSSVLLALFVLLSAALVVAALLLATGLKSWAAGEGKRLTAVLFITLSLLLLVKIMHSAYQYTLWDNTTDPLGLICLSGPIAAVFLVGIVLLFALPGKLKLAGLAFALAVPLALSVVSAFAQDVEIVALTEERADQISGALAAYYAENGRYPQDLRQLQPRYLLLVPEPAIIFAQDWCYAGGEAGYALGYVNRDHWSDPRLYGRVRAVGEWEGVPGNEVCAEAIAALVARGTGYFEVREDAGE